MIADLVAKIGTNASPDVPMPARDAATPGIYPRDMVKISINDWLADGLEKSGMSQAELARQLGEALSRSIPRSAVNKMVLNNREIAADEMLAIASILGIPAPGGSSVPDRPELARVHAGMIEIPNAGHVEAGAFRAAPDFSDVEEEPTLGLPDPKFPWARLVSFSVGGDSMNRLAPRPIFAGDKIICVDFEDLDGRVPLRDGMIVVVERTRDGGHLREWSVKQLELYTDRMEFHPRSTNPKHKPIVIPLDEDADDGKTVRILALVRQITNEIPL